HRAAVRLDEAEEGAHQGGLAGAVRSDERHDLAAAYREADALQHGAAAEADLHVLRLRQDFRKMGGSVHLAAMSRHWSHRPTTSMAWAPTWKPAAAALRVMAEATRSSFRSTIVPQARPPRSL